MRRAYSRYVAGARLRPCHKKGAWGRPYTLLNLLASAEVTPRPKPIPSQTVDPSFVACEMATTDFESYAVVAHQKGNSFSIPCGLTQKSKFRHNSRSDSRVY